MTDQHPLTDEKAFKKFWDHTVDVAPEILYTPDGIRAAADWQLEQVIEWLKDNMRKHVYQDYYGADEQQEVFKCLEDRKIAMRPQENN